MIMRIGLVRRPFGVTAVSLKQFFGFCERNYDEVKAIHIRAWLAHLEEKGLKPRSVFRNYWVMPILIPRILIHD